ncbi:MAG: radical SAM protein, partial [Candidatus Cloacimonadota bacterium]
MAAVVHAHVRALVAPAPALAEEDKKMSFKKAPSSGNIRLFHKRGAQGRFQGYRLHLRENPDGTGLLIINASHVLHLNKTATEFSKYIIADKDDRDAVKTICSRYRVKQSQAENDFKNLKRKILEIAQAEKAQPEFFSDMNLIDAFSITLTAPYRSDIVLTYQCNNACDHCYVERKLTFEEMAADRWKQAIGNLWDAGIPHITFTGGEPTLRKDLPELVGYAEEIGLVTGLITNGRLLTKELVKTLARAGLDHVQITLESHNEKTHNSMVQAPAWQETVEGIRNCLDSPLYVLTNTTLTTDNCDEIAATIEFLKSLGLQRFAYNSIIYSGSGCSVGTGIREEHLAPYVKTIKRNALQHQMDFVWYTPTHYCIFDPCLEEIGLKQCSAARYTIAIEPNGDVIPCQSY